MSEQTTQTTVEGEELEPKATVEKRARPSVRIRTDHFELKTNARVFRNTRKKDNAGSKFWDKVKPRQDARQIPEGAFEVEGKEIVSAALHVDLPDYDEEWETLRV